MRALLIKTSSFGDVVHTLPAISDAVAALPGLMFDWVLEPPFAPIATLHPGVARVIPLSMRSLRQPTVGNLRAWLSAIKALRESTYDIIIDAQGLLKSAPIALLARGRAHGYDQSSAREGWATLAYGRRHHVARNQHAIQRTRMLFAAALDYPLPISPPVFGISKEEPPAANASRDVFLVHATSWPSKLWALESWRELAILLAGQGHHVVVPAHGEAERQRAEWIISAIPNSEILPPMALGALAGRIASARAMVACDTGLAHLGGALGVPTLTLYGPTTPKLTGTAGARVLNLAAGADACVHLPCLSRQCRRANNDQTSPCLLTITPQFVVTCLSRLMTHD